MFARLPGLGVEGRVKDAQIVCGTPRLFTERGQMAPLIAEFAQDLVLGACPPSLSLATASRSV